MDQTANLKEVELNPTDQEYQNVETDFKNSLGGFGLTKVGKVLFLSFFLQNTY